MSVVAIVYHSFAHYREAIIRTLVEDGSHEYIFAADVADRAAADIEPTRMPAGAEFVHAPCRHVWRNVLVQRGLVRLALRKDIDCMIYFGNAAWPSTWLSAIVARLTGKRVLFWTHGWRVPDKGLKRRVRVLFYRLGHGLLLYGDRARDIAIDNGFSPENVYVIYNSLDYEQQRRLRGVVTNSDIESTKAALFDDPTRRQVIFSGRLITSKRVDLLIEALGLLRQDGQQYNLLIVGDGPCRDELKTRAKELGVSVKFYGACYQEDEIARLMMSSDVAVSPGPVGLSAMHAFGYRVPIVVSSNPEQNGPEWEAVEQGVNGYHFTENSPASLATAIRKCSELSRDVKSNPICSKVVDEFYNPTYQRLVIEAAVSNQPATQFPGRNPVGTFAGWLHRDIKKRDAA